jgi:hypothetical protein
MSNEKLLRREADPDMSVVGSDSDLTALRRDVCFASVSGHRQAVSPCPKSANSGGAELKKLVLNPQWRYDFCL